MQDEGLASLHLGAVIDRLTHNTIQEPRSGLGTKEYNEGVGMCFLETTYPGGCLVLGGLSGPV